MLCFTKRAAQQAEQLQRLHCACQRKQPFLSCSAERTSSSGAQCFIERFPQLTGQPFGHLARYFSDGLVLGLLDRSTGKCVVAPPADTPVSSAPELTGRPGWAGLKV